ncbi:MAG: UDP-2,3-diacylglucosamine diphosphatase [Aromatoleum sp.]|jgi:UDP-2,3-diacylglucosamine hydrolase|uniref:UDP-2,3-diacylglucosamine diphosphatase n=1 Tax=Aromatoleum sp. TaxID=2307007 RepID=UPI0028954ABC|nr:UDP-2,3-diacylglucosamine diphosphatase [Aromatoleum sp.]MDT3669848.1 UDP-2,3-diacylglucosamine diphosphatase [Aromatoleum sp.]
MRKQRPASALFISDLHLSDAQPATLRVFLSFLRGPARSAEALYILGDLFEYWAGDDDRDAPLHRTVQDALTDLSRAGVSIYFLAGNRDFLVGDAFAHAAQIELLPDPTLIEIAGQRVLLTHGDALCTDDQAYQAYRKQVRDPAWQSAFLGRPLGERKQIIESLREQSEAAKQVKATEIMDVNPSAVAALLREHAYPALLHGHTHRPAHHRLQVDGRDCERWVLEDWHNDAPYIRWDESGARMLRHAHGD